MQGGTKMELGITTFAETTPHVGTGYTATHAERLREIVEEIKLADRVGLDVYGVGEHHRKDYAASAPAVVLAAAAMQTERIKLTSAVTVLSSDDPVRVYEQFATLDGLSNGRAEIMAGRGSFIESFPLFGYDLQHYDELYNEKLELLLNIRDNEVVTSVGQHRPSIEGRGIYPRPVQPKIPVWIASGGTPQSAIRAGELGLPITFAIIGGSPLYFARMVELYYHAAAQAGHDLDALQIASHSHGFIADTEQQAIEQFYEPLRRSMNAIEAERGWGEYTQETFDFARSIDGALYVGDPETVAEKIILLRKEVGITRFMLHVPVGSMPHEAVMKSIELFGTKVAPIVRKEIERWEALL